MNTKVFSRRRFLQYSSAAMSGIPFIGLGGVFPSLPDLPKDATVQEVIDLLIKACTGTPLKETVDTVKTGDPSQVCTGIVTTFLATVDVIRQAAAQGANLIVTHEPTFYNHLDETDWLDGDPVYAYKKQLLEDNEIVVWRFHDYWHRHEPDGILQGFLKKVDWLNYLQEGTGNICRIPKTTLYGAAAYLKEKLDLDRCFTTGNPDQRFQTVALLPGAWGRLPQIEALRRKEVEVIVVGEVAEWETCEWVRDAAAAGMNKGLIVLGHAQSEEPGMAYLAEWLQPKTAEIPVVHIPAEDPFRPV